MHSSRMRTARLLIVSHSARVGGGLPNPPAGRLALEADPLDTDPNTLEADPLVM